MTRKFMKYNPAFLSDEELLHSFVVRHADLELIIKTIRENSTESNQHVLIIGPRGSGKTTLVRRIALEIKTDENLQPLWYPLIFAEESYEVISAGEFWLEALFHISEQTGDMQWRRTYEELKSESDEKVLRERALSQLMDFADTQGKRLLLMVENINMLFDQLSGNDAWDIRHTLLNESRIMLLATTTPGCEEIENSGHAMFELFKMQELKALDERECSDMWKMVTGFKAPDNRIRPLQILTGGNPRLLAIISKFGAKLSLKELMDDLIHLVDDHTDYFKSQLDNLATTERKAYLALAEIWDPATAREIATAARLDVNKTSSLLSRLVKRGYVTIHEASGKNKWYQVKERLYNIYYLMRRRGAPANRVKAVVRFMINFYGHDDLVNAAKLIAEEACNLSLEESRDHYFAYEAIIRSSPAQEIRDEIIKLTPDNFFEPSKIPPSIKSFSEPDIAAKEAMDVVSKGLELAKSGNYTKAINILDIIIGKYKERPEPQIASLVAQGMVLKGITLGLLRRFEELLKVNDELIQTYKNYSEPNVVKPVAMAMVNKGVALGELGQLEKAIQVYDTVVEIYKDCSEPKVIEQMVIAMVKKGISLGELGRFEEEIQVYDTLLNIYMDHSEPKIAKQVAIVMVNKSVALTELERLEEAIQVSDKLIKIYKDYSDPEITEQVAVAMAIKGVCLGVAGCPEEEADMYLKAVKHKEDYFFGWEKLITLVLERGEDQKEGLKLAKTCINKNPNNPEIINEIAWLFYKYGDKILFAHAEKWAKVALNLAPDKAIYHHTLACILAAMNKGEEAFVHAEEYLKDIAIIEKQVDDAIELFVELAAAGFAKEALELLVKSPGAITLEPLIAGLKLFMQKDVKAAEEIMEIARDIVTIINERQEKRGKSEMN